MRSTSKGLLLKSLLKKGGSKSMFEKLLGGRFDQLGDPTVKRPRERDVLGNAPKRNRLFEIDERKPFFNTPLNNKGVALLLVIGAMVVLTLLAVEFAYNAQVEYHIARRQLERLQAYYLARSAYQLTLLELRLGNAVQNQIANFTSGANVQLPFDLSAPLCQQFPIKTALFRLVAGSEEESTQDKAESAQALVTAFPLTGVREFLEFEGDFEADCVDESSKINLNYFWGQDPAVEVPEGKENAYDEYKHFLVTFFSNPRFQELLKSKDLEAEEVVRNIADWVDENERVNDYQRGQGGAEESVYQGLESGEMAAKNGKLSTPGDIFTIAKISQDWWEVFQDYFTIYGPSDSKGKPQVNVCRAKDDVVEALILRYTDTRSDLPPLRLAGEEALKQLVATVKSNCTGPRPDKNKITQELDSKLLQILKVSVQAETPPQATAGYGVLVSPFVDWITTENRFFSLKLSGSVKDTVVRVHAVVDVGEGGGSDPKKWKLLYWRVE